MMRNQLIYGAVLSAVALAATLAGAPLVRPGAVAAAQGPAAQQAPPARAATRQTAPPSGELLSKYCVTCHNQRLRTAGLALDQADLASIAHDPAVWEKVVRKLRTGAMPPAGRPRPEPAAAAAFATAVEAALDADAAANPNPG